MRKLSLLVVLLVISIMSMFATRAADTSLSLNFPAGGSYFDLYVPFAAGDVVTLHFDCNLQSIVHVPGSIDPYLELSDPAGGFIALADDEGSSDCASFNDAILTHTASTSGTYHIWAADISDNGGVGTLTITGSSLVTVNTVNPIPLAADGRLNPDPSAPVVVYCEGDNYDIYQLVGERGVLAIRELRAELDDMENPAENTLLASSEDGTVRLYLLKSGEFQLNAPLKENPNGYIFIFHNCEQRGAVSSSPSNIGISGPTIICKCGPGR